MADIPLDLSKLPTPQGCRWESVKVKGYQRFVLFENETMRGLLVGRGGKWGVYTYSGSNVRITVKNSLPDAADAILAVLSLTPAPAGRTFTEAELNAIIDAIEERVPEAIGITDNEWYEILTAAIAAATDAGKDGPQ